MVYLIIEQLNISNHEKPIPHNTLLFSIALLTSCKQETLVTQNDYFAPSSDSIQNGGVKVILSRLQKVLLMFGQTYWKQSKN